jgi:hypothetical protein
MDAARPLEIEPLSNRLAIHRASAALLPAAVRLGLHPNLVTLASLGFGLLAGLAYLGWRDWRLATLGFGLMLAWLVMDGLDGKLARATDTASDLGRLLDGVADYSTFVAVYAALALTHDRPALALAFAVAGGAAHALQGQFYEGERLTYIRRLAGQYEAPVRQARGGAAERLYNRGEALLGNRTRPFDTRLAAAPAGRRAAMLAAWQPAAARRLRAMAPLSANGRAFVIWIAALLGEPMLYWAWEILVLTLLSLAGAHALRQSERAATGAGT